MGEIYETARIPARLHEPLRQALAGRAGGWPAALDQSEIAAMVEHGVVPLVYAVADLPQLRDLAIHAAAGEPGRLAVLATVLEALSRRGVDVLILKGSALAYEIYDSPHWRPRGDTDLLIPAGSLQAAREAMTSLGFQELPGSGDEHGVRQVMFRRGPEVYDVHWSVANSALVEGVLPFDELRPRAVRLSRISEHAWGLGRVDALLLACVHRVAHHHDSDRLIWLADIALLRDRMSADEHRQFWELAARRRVTGICSRSVELADEWTLRGSRHRAEEYLEQEAIRSDEPSRVLMNRRMTHGRLLAANLGALPWRARARRMWQLALPPRVYMERSFHSRSRLALPWLYVYRGVRGLARLLQRISR